LLQPRFSVDFKSEQKMSMHLKQPLLTAFAFSTSVPTCLQPGSALYCTFRSRL